MLPGDDTDPRQIGKRFLYRAQTDLIVARELFLGGQTVTFTQATRRDPASDAVGNGSLLGAGRQVGHAIPSRIRIKWSRQTG